jgi:hypothetical protein|tara:strand:+ start:501 stop:1493 length:993 start_codon:yes stop_codon:yes gene_type:complete
MGKIIGRLVDVGVAVEGTRGTSTTPTHMIPKSNLTFDDKVLKARSAVGYGNLGMEGNQALVARRHAEGVLDFDLTDQSFGIFLKSLLGTLNTTGPTDSAYTHTFSLQNDNSHPSLSIYVEETSIGQHNFRLCMIESMTITIVPEEVVKVSANFMSKPSETAGNQNVAYIAENKFLGRHLSFKIETLTSGLAAGANIPVRSLTINIEKNLRLIHNSGTVEPDDILNQGFRITGEVELDYEGRTYANLMSDGSYRAVRIQLINTEATVGAGSTTPKLTIDLSRVDFEQWEAARPNDEVTSQTFQFQALFDITNGNIINDFSLVNEDDGTSYA